jgi:hypothetical protein
VKDKSNSSPQFPPDLLVASCIPVFAGMFLSSWLFQLRQWHWVIAYCCALLIAMVGALYLFRAKLPLFRRGLLFTFGSRQLPPSSLPLYRRGRWLSIIGVLLASMLLLSGLAQRGP